jgi:phospholipid/cholesterol/gamma-HCH transport system ATP-binding protein
MDVGPTPAAIEIEDVHKILGGRVVLAGLSLRVPLRERLGILGRSGSGKTVLLKHVVGLLRPDRGKIRVEGIDVGSGDPTALRAARAKVGYLFQSAALLNSLTVFDNIALPLREGGGRGEAQIRAEVLEGLRLVGLEQDAHKFPAELSGGMKKRAGLARALVGRRRIFLLDEPTTGLDPAGATEIRDLIRDVHDRLEATTVFVTHDMNLAVRLSNRMAILAAGRIHALGTPAELARSDDALVREFLAGVSAPAA